MTIQTDSFNASVDFIYTFNGKNNSICNILNLKVRYHMTETYGETVTIWQEIGPGDFSTTALSFPVNFFTEISNLLSKGINIGSLAIKNQVEQKATKKEVKKILPFPDITGGNIINTSVDDKTNDIVDDKAIESFSSTDNKDKDEIDENVIHEDKKEEVSSEKLEKEAAEIIEERKQALAKASKNKDAKRISRKE